jgi:hypothetical protein
VEEAAQLAIKTAKKYGKVVAVGAQPADFKLWVTAGVDILFCTNDHLVCGSVHRLFYKQREMRCRELRKRLFQRNSWFRDFLQFFRIKRMASVNGL